MRIEELETEQRPDVLREFAKLTLVENARLTQEVSELKKAQVKTLEQLKLGYQDKLSKLQSKLFAKGSESVDKDMRPKRSGDLLPHGESLNPSTELKKNKKARDRNLPESDVVHSMTEDELKNEAASRGFENASASDWKELPGVYDSSSEITVTERTYVKVNHKRKKYLFKPSVGTEKEIIVAAKAPERLISGGGFSVDFAIQVTCDKYQYHTPLNRQIEQMQRKGLTGITAKTIYRVTDALGEHGRRQNVMEKIKKDIFSVPLAVHADETTWPILDEKDSDGYMWAICNMAGAYYQFEPSRSGRQIVEMLKGYSGPLLTDKFSGYNRVKKETKCVLCYCWSHARRNFYDIRKNHPEDCPEILKLIDDLFDVEREAGPSFARLKLIREEKSVKITDSIKKWLDEKYTKYLLSEDEMLIAIRYLLNHWKEFTVFLTDVRVPLSNNHAERALRHSVLGRKNFNGSKTINGADVAAEHYTIIETCKLVNLEPESYYRYLVKTNHAGGDALSPLGYVKHLWDQHQAAA
jgi:transposase